MSLFKENILEENGLLDPELDVLKADGSKYTILAIQIKGEISTAGNTVKNADENLARKKLTSFFNLAKDQNINLALTPEYSCPWSVLDEMFSNKIFPTNSNIWIVGCEGIKVGELNNFISKQIKNNITCISEINGIADHASKYLNCICYIFKTKDKNNNELKVLLLQFKTFPMAVNQFEIDHMICGTQSYILKNRTANSIRLATVICSESSQFSLDEKFHSDSEHLPFLLYHPQLNKSPLTYNFKQYRTAYYHKTHPPANIETICLNWAKGTNLAGYALKDSGSSLYLKHQSICTLDATIEKNDNLGLYYHNWKSARASIYKLSSAEAVFLIETYKVSQRDAPAQYGKKHGPAMHGTFIWENDKWTNIASVTLDALNSLCDNKKSTAHIQYLTGVELSPLDKERLISISVGKLDGDDWVKANNIALIAIGDNEISKRISCCENVDGDAYREKESLIEKFDTLNSIISNQHEFPAESSFDDLKDGCQIKYSKETLTQNVRSTRNIGATLTYIGDNSEARAREILGLIAKEFKHDQNSKRIVVWYVEGGNRKYVYDLSPPSVTDNTTKSVESISSKRRA